MNLVKGDETNCSTAPRDSATDIETISRKGAPEGEQPNRSVVITVKFDVFKNILCFFSGKSVDFYTKIL